MQNMLGFSNTLIKWYYQNKRELPWRETRDPYKIWVSEIILQQTRVEQGLPYYHRFIEAFPTVSDLARAESDYVLRLWQGLGYYSRARNMQQAAIYVMEQLDGRFPENFTLLLAMKGVGRYTAAAIASFAYGECVPVVDGNVQRVLARLFGVQDDVLLPKTFRLFEQIALAHIPENDPATFNQAIMEFGSQYCVPNRPNCADCIFKTACYAYENDMVSKLPVKLKKTKVRQRYFHYAILVQGNTIAMQKRQAKDIWQGLYEFVLLEHSHFLEFSELVERWSSMGIVNYTLDKESVEYTHLLSHQKLHVKFYVMRLNKNSTAIPDGFTYFSVQEVADLAKPVLLLNFLEKEDFL
jgi:A/G-specific adenine glycosylase